MMVSWGTTYSKRAAARDEAAVVKEQSPEDTVEMQEVVVAVVVQGIVHRTAPLNSPGERHRQARSCRMAELHSSAMSPRTSTSLSRDSPYERQMSHSREKHSPGKRLRHHCQTGTWWRASLGMSRTSERSSESRHYKLTRGSHQSRMTSDDSFDRMPVVQ